MNIIEAEDMVKGLPDQVLFQYAQSPPPTIPQFLVVSEVQRRQDMRQRFQAQQQQQQGTVKDQILQGIGGTGMAPEMSSPPPMAPQMPQGGPPMGGPPPGGPPPVAAFRGGMMPYGMAGGGSVPPGQANPQVLRNFLQRNFGTPQGLATNIGMVGGALLGGPLGSVAGANIGSYLGDKMSRSVEMSDWDRARLFAKPFSQAADQQEVPAEPPPFVDGMAMGGQIPYRMQTGRVIPGMSRASLQRVEALKDRLQEAILANAPSEQIRAIRAEIESLSTPRPASPGAEDYQTFQRIREAGVSPQVSTPALEMPAPDFQIDVPAEPKGRISGTAFQGARDLADFLRRDAQRGRPWLDRPVPRAQVEPPATTGFADTGPFSRENITATLNRSAVPAMTFGAQAPTAPPTAPPNVTPGGIVTAAPATAPPPTPPLNVSPGGIGDLAPRQPRAGGMSVTGMASELFKPQEISEQEQALINLINQQREQGVPAPLDLEPYRQAALERQKEARDEARRTAIAGTLMSLGTGLVAGDPAAGLRQATQTAMETLREGRREAAAEGRSAEQLQLQAAQQARQAQIEKMQFDRESLGTVANIYKDLNKSNKESRERALQIFATYDASLESNLSRMQEQGALDRRSILSAITAAEDRIEDALEAQVGMSAEDKETIRTTMRNRAIRQIGSLFPSLDVEGMIGGGGSQGATANRFSIREVKPGQ